jgi:hypothetical protein
MASPKQAIFREHALKQYLRRQNQGIILRLVSPPIFVFCWILLLLLLAAGVLAWRMQVPIFFTGQGIMVKQEVAGQEKAQVAVFISPNQQQVLHVGQTVDLQVGPAATQIAGVIEHIDNQATSPDEVRARFHLRGDLARLITGPSLTVLVSLKTTINADLYVGSFCSARVRIGSRSVLSLLPGFNLLFST